MNVEHLAAVSGTPASASRPAAAPGSAWQRQLQRAQSAGWFVRADGLLSTQARDDGASARPLARPAVGDSKPTARFPFTTPQAPLAPSGTELAGPASGHRFHADPYALARVRDADALDAVWKVIAGNPVAETRLAGIAPEDVDCPEQHPAPLPSSGRRDARAPRIHVEEGVTGLQVWLGLDGSANELAARVGAVVADLHRQCERSGIRLAEVTCNGVPMRTRKEP